MKQIFISMMTGLVGSILFVLIFNYKYQRSFVVIKMDQIVASHISEYGQKNLSREERDEISKKFAFAIDKAISVVSERQKVIILVAPAVVSQLPDYTNKILEEIKGDISVN
jgi:hypothetical protein